MSSLTDNKSFLILLFLGVFALSFVCDCSPPKPSPDPVKPPQPPAVKPPKPPTKPPSVKPLPSTPKPPMKPPTIKPLTCKPPSVATSPTPCPPPTPTPTVVTPPTPTPPVVAPPTPTPPIVTPPTPIPPEPETCPIDTLKLGACVDVLGGCIHMGIGKSHAKETCCPVLGGLFSMDAAICLCTTIEAKLFNMDLIIPIAFEILLDCGRPPPPGFKCPT